MTVKSDAMLTRLEKEVEERNAFIESIIANAQDAERDLTDTENELMGDARKRIEVIDRQIATISESRGAAMRARKNVEQSDRELDRLRAGADRGEVEYRSAGAYIVDTLAAHLGSADAREKLEVFHRTAAHQTTADNAGLLPDPIVGPIVSFIDATRPLVMALGTQPITTSPFRRSRVTQHTQVGRQTDGTTDDITEKVELSSRKMLITSDTVTAETYGGYVNVSRQNIDWSSPNVFDTIVNDLAEQYAITTEAVACDALQAVNTTAVEYPLTPTADELATKIWDARADVYTAVKGKGSVLIAIAPDRLAAFGPLFAPYGPQNQQGTGFTAAAFGQGPVGVISGIPVYMTAGLASGEAFVLSTAALELFEQRIGTLQVVEPSVLGVQIAYAGYFATYTAAAGGIVPLEEGTA
ncbi:MAG TPA: hypothetical protein VGK49_03005 [Ilumatobacteraceae bacterium]